VLTAADQGWLSDPVESGSAAGFGVYLHVPFCAHRCGYCDFATSDRHAGLIPRYVTALRTDIQRTVAGGPAAATGWPQVTSIFVGGGTPTLLDAGDLAGIVALVGSSLPLADDAEITVECNPESLRPGLFEALVDAGVNRISLGVQSFAGHVLSFLERQHTPDKPAETVAAARQAGIAQVSLDLIFGTPGETATDWHEALVRALELQPDHLSAYALTVHDNTRLGRQVAAGERPAPDDDVQRDRWDTAREVLGAAGFDHYEVSNWARTPSRRSRHNVLYWRHGDYLGLGVGAHGHLRGRRWWRTRSIEGYVDAVEAGRSLIAGSEQVTIDEQAEERLLLGLRLREGLHPRDVPPLTDEVVQDAADAGLLQLSCGRFQTTEQGWFLLDETVNRLT